MMFSEQQMVLDGLPVNFVKAGSGFPMIFLHNGNGFWQSWQHQLEYFSKQYEVFAFDWPGCGESAHPGEPLYLDKMHTVLQEFVKANGLQKFHLVGNCIGATEALHYAIAFPHQVEKLVLLNICPGDLLLPSMVNKRRAAAYRYKPVSMQRRRRLLHLFFPSVITDRFFPAVLFGSGITSSDPLFRKYRRRQKEENQKRTKVDMYFAAHSYNLLPIIEGAVVPDHLLLWGEENKVAGLKEHGMWHHQQLASREFHVISKAGHLCAYEQPEVVNTLIEKYLHA